MVRFRSFYRWVVDAEEEDSIDWNMYIGQWNPVNYNLVSSLLERVV